MYTTYPLPPIDTLNSHGGLFLFAVVWFVVSLFISDTLFDWIVFIGATKAADAIFTQAGKEFPGLKDFSERHPIISGAAGITGMLALGQAAIAGKYSCVYD